MPVDPPLLAAAPAASFTLPAASRAYRRAVVQTSAGWAYCDRQPPTIVAEHRHDRHVQLTVMFGEAECVAGWKRDNWPWETGRRISGDHVWLVPPGMEHTLDWRREADLFVSYVDPEQSRRLVNVCVSDISVEPLSRYTDFDPLIGELCQRVRKYCREPGISNQAAVAGIGSALSDQLLIAHFAPRHNRHAQRHVLSRSLLASTRAYIEEHLGEKISLALLARKAGLSPSYFGQMFRAATGVSPLRYVIDRRIVRAQKLLRTGDFSVKEVAHDVGFSDQHHMDYHFRTILGNPPSSYVPR